MVSNLTREELLTKPVEKMTLEELHEFYKLPKTEENNEKILHYYPLFKKRLIQKINKDDLISYITSLYGTIKEAVRGSANIKEDDVVKKIDLLVEQLENFPKHIFNKQLISKAIKKFHIFPSVGEVYDFIDEARNNFEAELSGMTTYLSKNIDGWEHSDRIKLWENNKKYLMQHDK